MATSDTDIVNLALRELKAGRIANITDGSKNANVALDVYARTREKLLRGHAWNFATKRAILARSATTPAYEYDYGYALPSDWIRTISVHDNDAGAGTVDYREEELDGQGVLMSSAEAIYLRYVYRLIDPNRMTADFHDAFAYALAVAMPGIGNIGASREAEIRREAKTLLRAAKSSDALAAPPERRPVGSWRLSRGGWPGRRGFG